MLSACRGNLPSDVVEIVCTGWPRVTINRSLFRTAVLAYDAQGYLASFTDPLGHCVRFEDDLAGRVARQIRPDWREILYGHNAEGYLTSLPR